LYYFGIDFLSFHLTFWETQKMDFWHNSYYLSNDNVCSRDFYVFTHLCLFEWKTSSKCFLRIHMNGITFHIKLKWDNEFICNKWSSISSNLAIIWMVFEIYLHFIIYHDDYNFFTTILFNNLISISKVDFFTIYSLGFELPYCKYGYKKTLLIWTW